MMDFLDQSLETDGGDMNTKHVSQNDLATFPTFQPFLLANWHNPFSNMALKVMRLI